MSAAVSQTLIDDYYLQPWLDKKLRQTFYFDGDAKTLVEDYLSPYIRTAKVGDDIGN